MDTQIRTLKADIRADLSLTGLVGTPTCYAG